MSEPVSKKAQANTLQTLPLELRLRIYEFVAVRPTGPRLVLKEWLEKIDPNIDTTTPATVTLGQTINANGDLVDSDSDADDGSEAADDVMADGEDEDEDEDEDIDADDGEEDGDADGDADDDLDDADDDDLDNGITNGGNGFQLVNGIATISSIAVTIGRHTKYRHSLPIIKLNACPPPMDLLLVSHQIKNEAYSGIYNKMILEIDATKGFRHVEFFLEILGSLQTEPVTPLHHIRNAAVTFVWDTQWFQAHAHEPQADICNQILRLRGNLTHQLICAIPNLTKLTLNWHDSEESDDSLAMRSVVLEPFDEVVLNVYGEPIDINIINHFEQQDTGPKPSGLVSAMRQELDEILTGKDFC